MSYTWIVILSCSIFIAALIAIIRFRQIDKLCHPFIFCIWIGSTNELISIIMPQLGATTAVNNNIYVLLEALLLLWQFWNWAVFDRRHSFYIILLLLIPFLWGFENFILASIEETKPWFRLFYSFLVVLAAIHVINKLIITERRALYRHPVFILCTGLILFFTCKLIIEACWVGQLYVTPGFMLNIYIILMWINFFVNIVYAIALVWMPGKLPFSLPY